MNIRMISSRQQSTESLHHATAESMVKARKHSDRNQTLSPAQRSCASIDSGLSQPECATLRRRLAMAHAQQGDYAEAIHLLTMLISQNPENASDYNNRGLLHFQNGQPDQALTDYNQALQLNPRLAKVYNNRANCYVALGKLVEAIADYETALDLNPANVHPLINLGITFRDLECYEQAIEHFDLALQFNDLLGGAKADVQTHLQGHIYAERGRTYHLAGDWNCAVADYQRALAQLPGADASAIHVSCRLRLQVDIWLDQLLNPRSRV